MVWRGNSTFLEGFLPVLLTSASLKGRQALAVLSTPLPFGGSARHCSHRTVTLNLCPALTWVNPATLSACPPRGVFPA